MDLTLNDYGLEFDSILGSLYLPWKTISLGVLIVVVLRLLKLYKGRK